MSSPRGLAFLLGVLGLIAMCVGIAEADRMELNKLSGVVWAICGAGLLVSSVILWIGSPDRREGPGAS